ncbi:hypothetical protein AGMMS49992_15780 [Clostridia bacterium]|nr:hypothetical protein AGMMS49992_15780 [Clostridia bacterium]
MRLRIWNGFRNQSVFVKLMLTYVIAVFLVSAIIAVSANYLTSRSYQAELANHTSALLMQYRNLIETDIFSRAEDISTRLMSADGSTRIYSQIFSPAEPNLPAIRSTLNELNQAVFSTNGIVNEAYLLSVRHRMVLSSKRGLYLLDTRTHHAEDDPIWNSATWPSTVGWHEIDTVTDGQLHQVTLRLTHAYPTTLPAEKAVGYVVADINTQYLRDMLGQLTADQGFSLILIDAQGNVLAQTADSLPKYGTAAREYMPKGERGQFISIDGVRHFTSASPAFSNGWRIVLFSPVQTFYASLFNLQKWLMLICALCLLVGTAIAWLFSRTMYSPLRNIVSTIRSIFTGGAPSLNEYAFIDSAILHLNSTVSELNRTLETNKPLLKHNLILSLTGHTIHSQDALLKRLELINSSFKGKHYLAAMLLLDDRLGEIVDDKDILLFKIEITQCIEARFIGQALVTEERENEIIILLAADSDVPNLADDILSGLPEHPARCVCLSLGEWVESPLDLSESIASARSALQYRYFHPEQYVFLASELTKRSSLSSVQIDALLRSYEKQLHRNLSDEACEAARAVIDTLRNGQFPLSFMQEKLQSLPQILSRYALEAHIWSEDQVAALHVNTTAARDIDAFSMLLRSETRSLIASHKQDDSRSAKIAADVRMYISDHLSEDLSLTHLADFHKVSAGYLSRIFKEYTGTQITGFVTQQRLESARRLLLESTLSISEIANRSGYETPHYFSQKFKEAYGVTPKEYAYLARKAQTP